MASQVIFNSQCCTSITRRAGNLQLDVTFKGSLLWFCSICVCRLQLSEKYSQLKWFLHKVLVCLKFQLTMLYTRKCNFCSLQVTYAEEFLWPGNHLPVAGKTYQAQRNTWFNKLYKLIWQYIGRSIPQGEWIQFNCDEEIQRIFWVNWREQLYAPYLTQTISSWEGTYCCI